ncbi:MAG TPA: hypothetical protein VGQ21_18350 [Thermoanaerobaculia bacterium]|jgi:hypothetical protein|nr:hypothetical protein [Thermoanaerobaculia bacterium]
MAEETFTRQSLQPKPYVFVLMPFGKAFSDIYQFGIKGAAEDAGAYAERLDDQIFTDGILDRIFNQINLADVVVADMTGRNANLLRGRLRACAWKAGTALNAGRRGHTIRPQASSACGVRGKHRNTPSKSGASHCMGHSRGRVPASTDDTRSTSDSFRS